MAIDTAITYIQGKYVALDEVVTAPTSFVSKIPQTHLPWAWTYVRESSIDMKAGYPVADVILTTVVLVFQLTNTTSWVTGPATANSILDKGLALWFNDPTAGGTCKAILNATGRIENAITFWDGGEYYGLTIDLTARIAL